MEIPYIVTPRKDTGLFNSKIAIWLFLASEVMLFGGFFSAYVFLRLGADFPWPERTLPVMPGLINTFVLIGSSVTVVFAWASLKLGNWRMFQLFMGITVACAGIFMVLKGIEYNVKFHHQAVRLPDFTVVEGHLAYEKDEKGYVLNHHGKKIEENMIFVEAKQLNFSTVRFHKPWVEEFISQAEHRNAKILLASDLNLVTEFGKPAVTIGKANEPLSVELLAKIKKAYLAARAHNAELRTDALRLAWREKKAEFPDKKDWELTRDVNVDASKLELLEEVSTVTFNVDPPAKFEFKPRDIKEDATSSRLRDDTVITGPLLPSPMVFHHMDAVDFRHLAMRAKAKGQDPIKAIDDSWLVQNNPFVKKAWEWNKLQVAKIEKELIDGYGRDEQGKPKREPIAKERYRLGWKEFAAIAEGKDRGDADIKMREEFLGPDYAKRGDETFPEFSLPREKVAFASKFTPTWNTYYALYFTITGLHGLHVIGGALVLAYYLFFGRKMFDENPEWLANRVEIGGLFWHFVDLVWIFVFPIFYLM
ncbi:MAG: heme-copper oxidase subunit III [Verrucomicrobia bacterium]|nr:MAG: heme-copper oxidase subunit III [Verrucomicrobiota bacterium]